MPKKAIHTHLVHQSSENTPLGCVTTAAYLKNSGGLSRSPMRVLGTWALVYIVEGGGWYADQQGLERQVIAGDLLIIFPDVGQAYGPNAGGSWSEIYLIFDGPVFNLWRSTGLLSVQNPVLHLDPIDYWLGKVEAIVADGTALEMVTRLQLFLAEALGHQRAAEVNDDQRQFLLQARALLDDAARSGGSPHSIAQQMGLPYETFRKRFVVSGLSPGKYLTMRVMARASDLLHHPEITLREIAQRCGFCDEFHFSKRFKKAVGVSPQQFRRTLGLAPVRRPA